ncbi:SDR family NAD(P)-dependent oxidoreductase [Archangium sp.]|uniref:SDR family NAD(P)-dependent oxidoreductase n=1 Tax=Archangium sp. TaxID=1872627 RepID=UPI002D263E99|nr:SDR family NAD(P)-dependent oxidoreductase [Archangium sp.]HYO56082.1 SDR family NAD(P)-dependent oxidoreductase [Archangium sp.]
MTESENQLGPGTGSAAKAEQEGAEAGDEQGGRETEPIAVVGLACRFPGAPDAEAFWRLLCERKDLLREVPPDRWDNGTWYDADLQAPGKMNTRHGYFLDGVSGFDPLFFGISPREAAEMDPQQRLMLEVCWEALEDAGLPAPGLRGSRTGVFMGTIWHDYADRHLSERAAVTLHSATGQSLNIVANRLSYFLGLRGPSLTVDTACSSSLVAVHLACQSLRSGESRLALVGGVNLMFSPEANVLLSKFGGLSPDGRSKAFAAGADGFGRGEGAGLVVLQPLSAALASGARIYCIIRGSAVNNNGTGNGLTAPSVPGQAALLREAYARAGVPINRVHYVETHGTGTALGDPTEASALGAALGEGRAIDRPLLIGSVKANIGHLEGAAGITGLIKVALSISRRLVPPHMMHGEPSPRIPFGELRLSLPQRLMPWPSEDEPATAGVSAFGWGGTNAHVVLEESPVGREELLPLAADSAEELLAQAAKAEELVQHDEAPVCVRDLCRTWALHAGRGGHRAAFTFRTRAELATQLKSFRQGRRRAGLLTGAPGEPPRVAFICAPQGSQWPAMGRELLATEPVFRARLEALDTTFMPLAGWSLVEALRDPRARVLSDEDATEPLTLAVQVGLVALWRAWGVEPEVVMGHGVGEVAAACMAGGMEAADAVWKVYRASRLRQWEPLRDELEAAQEKLRERGAGVRWVSTVAREMGPDGRMGDSRCRTLRQPVRFAQTVERLMAEGVDVFVELGPHPVLCRPVEQLLRKAGRPGVVVGSLRRDEARGALLEALGTLHVRGVQVRWEALPPPESPVAEVPSAKPPAGTLGRTGLLPLSAQTPEALAETARRVVARLEAHPLSLHDVCYSASVHRGHLNYRLALLARTTTEVRDGLTAFLRGEVRPGLSVTRHADGRHQPVVFVFPGQGSQWLGMGRRLMAEEPVFRSALEQCDAALRRFVDWSLMELLASDNAGWMERIDQVQPALFSIQVALARLWRAWGVVPDMVVGHSMGEVAAAHVAGALDLVDAARIICRRSLLLRRVSGQGGMAVVELTLDEARVAIRGLEDLLSVAASNSPRSTVLSGEPHALDQVLEKLEARHVFCRRVKVDVASHSPQMEPLREDLLRALEGLAPRRGEVSLFSTVTGEVTDGTDLEPSYWVRNLREPVLLAPVVERLATNGHSLFVEVSPHPVLLPSIEQTIAHLRMEGTVLPSLRREQPEREVMLETLGGLYAAGREVEWKALHPESGRLVRLPDYPWQRQDCWFQPGAVNPAQKVAREERGHSLLGPVRRSSLRPGAFFWDVEVGVQNLPWLGDHRVQGTILLPTTAYLDWVSAAVQSALGPGPWVLEDLRINEALALLGDGMRRVELLVDVGSTGAISFKVSSFIPSPGGSSAEMWTLHAQGRVRASDASGRGALPPVLVEDVQRRCTEVRLTEVHYLDMEQRGLQYGPTFRGVKEVWRSDGEAVGRISVPESLGPSGELHPAVLDAALQVLLEALPSGDTTFVPVRLRRFEVLRRGTPQWAYARLPPQESWRKGTPLEGDVVLLDGQGMPLAEVEGLELSALPTRYGRARAEQDRSLFEIAWRRVGLPAVFEPGSAEAPWLVFQDASGVGAALAVMLESWGGSCIRVEAGSGLRRFGARHFAVNPGSREELRAVLQQCLPSGGACSGVAYLWGLDMPAPDVPGERALDEAVRLCGGALRIVQEVLRLGWRDPPRLWLVTRGAYPVLGSPATGALQAALWGLGRVVGHEHPELRCTCVDLEPSSPLVDVEALGRELAARAEDEQVALRAGARFAARLVRRSGGKELLMMEPLLPVAGRPFQVETPPAGSFGGVSVRMAERRRPGPGEVEIAVEASALNFIDVMKTMGLYVMKDKGRAPGVPLEGLPLGLDCAGRVVAVGEGVTDLTVGDEVVAFTPSAMASHVVTDARFAVRRPQGMSAAEASSIPSVFMTAWYALHHLARLRKGERVLIHSAAGGLGLAAVQIAQVLEAEVFATAGTPEKRELLRSLGIKHVMDSRTLAFADEVMRVTGGEGVDVVLNSLSGDAITRSMEVLAPDGRFLEVGNRDIHDGRALDLSQFRRRLIYAAIDLVGLREQRPALCSRLLREVVEQMAAGTLRPVRHRAFPVSQASEAFREMAQGQHVGKLVVTMEDPELRVVPPRPGFRVRADATYLITGGLGGLGLAAAQWLVGHGARHLLLTGRNAPSEAVQQELESLRAQGARVEVARADVADARRLAEVLALTHGDMPQLRGVLHCAGVLDDGILEQQEPARFRTVMAPKVQGAWNLHMLTKGEPLDFFVLYSSMSALLGLPGQGNYAAANAAMDALAHYRRQQGLPALSVNWGPFSEVGLAAAHSNRGERLAYQGMASFTPRQGDVLLERLLEEGAVQVGAVALDVRQWLEFFPSAASLRVWEELAAESHGDGQRGRSGFLLDLRRAASNERPGMLEGYLRERLSQVLRIDPSRVGRHEPFRGLGLDSLMSLELRNRIEAALDLKLSVTLLWAHSTLAALAANLLEQLGLTPKLHDAPVSVEQPSRVARSSATESESHQLAELPEGKLLEMVDDALAAWEDAK